VNRLSVGSWETFRLEVPTSPAPGSVMTAGGAGALVGPRSAAGWVALLLAGLMAVLVRRLRARRPHASREGLASRVASLSAASGPREGLAAPSPVAPPRRPVWLRGLGPRRPGAAPWAHAHDHPSTRCTMSRHMTHLEHFQK
jgi:hypothetical protein